MYREQAYPRILSYKTQAARQHQMMKELLVVESHIGVASSAGLVDAPGSSEATAVAPLMRTLRCTPTAASVTIHPHECRCRP